MQILMSQILFALFHDWWRRDWLLLVSHSRLVHPDEDVAALATVLDLVAAAGLGQPHHPVQVWITHAVRVGEDGGGVIVSLQS